LDEQEIIRLIKSLLPGPVGEIAEVGTVTGNMATVKRKGQTEETKTLPIVAGLTLAPGNRVVLLRLNGDLNSAVIIAKL
jgi:hypothetical protein